MEEVLAKKDEDGNSLVQFPANFDEVCLLCEHVHNRLQLACTDAAEQVVDAMSRDDIGAENPWYACLLEQPAPRGTTVSNEDAIERGMAQVRLLDAKLEQLNRVSDRQLG